MFKYPDPRTNTCMFTRKFSVCPLSPRGRPQIMNVLQMTVLAGSPGGFLPNMYPGTLAASLARVILSSAGTTWTGAEAASSEANDRLASKVQ